MKKYTGPFLRLASGAFSIPVLMSLSKAFFVLFHCNKTSGTQLSSLVPDPEAKASSSEIKNPTSFTVSYQFSYISMYYNHLGALLKLRLLILSPQITSLAELWERRLKISIFNNFQDDIDAASLGYQFEILQTRGRKGILIQHYSFLDVVL